MATTKTYPAWLMWLMAAELIAWPVTLVGSFLRPTPAWLGSFVFASGFVLVIGALGDRFGRVRR